MSEVIIKEQEDCKTKNTKLDRTRIRELVGKRDPGGVLIHYRPISRFLSKSYKHRKLRLNTSISHTHIQVPQHQKEGILRRAGTC